MQPVIIKFATKNGRGGPGAEVPGWVVPDTEGVFAVDMRYEADIESLEPADWKITHLPTGMSVSVPPYTEADCRDEAFAIAQRFYNELKAGGCDVHSTESAEITRIVKALPKEDVAPFWARVGGYSEKQPEQEPLAVGQDGQGSNT